MVLVNNRVNGAVSLLNWKILLSGYLPQAVIVAALAGIDLAWALLAAFRSRRAVRMINRASASAMAGAAVAIAAK